MMAYFFHLISFLLVMFVEFGFLHSFTNQFALVPLAICIGIYHVFHLRPYLGLAWLIGFGIVQDLHTVSASGDIIISVVLGVALIYVVEQHITHISLYAAIGTAGAIVFLWTAMRALVVTFFSGAVPVSLWLQESIVASILATITMWILMLGLPRIRSSVAQYIRLSS
ncbi:hypothetical protein HQ524_00835 [Candidatus Uhrbacteria bacterium]|nr:hypothetical protein [Candidatus Uhrbacteria bacterium]